MRYRIAERQQNTGIWAVTLLNIKKLRRSARVLITQYFV